MSVIEKQCGFGHYFDAKSPEDEDCPYCNQQKKGYRAKATLPIYEEDKPSYAPLVTQSTPPTSSKLGRTKTVPLYDAPHEAIPNTATTANAVNLAANPVAGWLVATVGPLRGQDFKIPLGRSSFGRDSNCRIVISGDSTISAQQGYINYSRNRRFTMSPGEGSSLLYVNGQEVLAPVDLAAYDVIEMGGTTMVFLPFCGVQFDWNGE